MVYTVLLDPQNPAGTQIEEAKLSELVERGVILATTQVWHAEKGRWIDAQSHAGLYALFAQSLWDAWDDDTESSFSTTANLEDGEEAERPKPHLEEVGTEKLTKNETPGNTYLVEKTGQRSSEQQIPSDFFTKSSLRDVAIDHQKMEIDPNILREEPPFEVFVQEEEPEQDSEEELPMLPELSLIPLDEVSSPRTPSQPNQNDFYSTSNAINPPLLIPLIPPRRERPNFVRDPKQFSFARVAIPIVMGAFFILGTLNYLQSLSMRQYPQQKKAAQELINPDGVLWKIEKKIREQIGEEIIPLNPEASFEDILHVELQRVGVTSHQIRASVVDWTGRKQDQPKKIDVRIRAESTGALDYDVASISLILGKYIEYYFLDVQRLEVCFAPDADFYYCAALNSEAIRRFYLKRIDHSVFFEDVFSDL